MKFSSKDSKQIIKFCIIYASIVFTYIMSGLRGNQSSFPLTSQTANIPQIMNDA